MFLDLNRIVYLLKKLNNIKFEGKGYPPFCNELLKKLVMINISPSVKEHNPLFLLKDITIIKLLLDNHQVFSLHNMTHMQYLSRTNREINALGKPYIMNLYNEINTARDKFVKFLNYRPWLKEFLEFIDISISEENVEQRLVIADEIIVFLTKFLDILNALNTETIETRTTQSSYIDFRQCPIFCNAFAEVQQQIDRAILLPPHEIYNKQFFYDLVERTGVVFHPHKSSRHKHMPQSQTFPDISSKRYKVKSDDWSPEVGLKYLQEQNSEKIWEPKLHPKLAIALAAILPQIRDGYCIRSCSYYLFLQYLMRVGIGPVESYDGYDLDGLKLHVVIKGSTNVEIYFHVNAPIIDIQPIEYLALQHDATVGPLPEAVFPQIKEIREQHGLQGNTRRVAEKSFYSFRAEFSLKYNTDNGRVIFSTRACGLHDYTKSRDGSPYGTMFSQLLVLHPELSVLKSNDASIQFSSLAYKSLTTQYRKFSHINTYVYHDKNTGEIRYVVNVVLPNGARKQFVMFYPDIAGAAEIRLMFNSQLIQAPDFIFNTAAFTIGMTREGSILRHIDRLYFAPVASHANLFSTFQWQGYQVIRISKTTDMAFVHSSKAPSNSNIVHWLTSKAIDQRQLHIRRIKVANVFSKLQHLEEVELLGASTENHILMIRVSATDPEAEFAIVFRDVFHNDEMYNDAVSWQTYTLGSNFNSQAAFKVLTANNELFVSGGEKNIAYSRDGKNWGLCKIQLEGCCQHLLWHNKVQLFIAIGKIGRSMTDNYILMSKDGINWNKSGENFNAEIIEVVIFDDLLYMTIYKDEKLIAVAMTIEQLQRSSRTCGTILLDK